MATEAIAAPHPRARGVLREDRRLQSGAAVGAAARARHRSAGDPMPAGDLALPRRAPLSDAGGRADQRRGGDAPRVDPRKPRAQGPHLDHPFAVRGIAIDPAGRGGAGASTHPIGIALHHRRKGRLHRGRRRAHDDAARRFRHHPVLDLARSRQRHPGADGLARRARYPDRAPARCELCRTGRGRNAGRCPPRGRQRRALCQQSGARRLAARGQDLAGVQLPLCPLARIARRAGPQRRPRPMPRPQIALCQPGERRFRDADDRRLHPAVAQGLCHPALPLDRRHGFRRGRGQRAKAGSATRSCAGSRAMCLSCRAGRRSAIRPRTRRCCSAIPTGRCSKSSASSASSAATPEAGRLSGPRQRWTSSSSAPGSAG